MRFGKCLEVFYSSLKTIHYPDLMIRFTLTFSKLAQTLFLLSDHMLWLSRTGLFRSINSKKWTQLSNKYWLLAIIMNLSRDVYEIMQLIDIHYTSTKNKSTIITTSLSRATTSITSSITRLNLSNISSISYLTRHDINRLTLYSYSLLYAHRDIVIDTVKNFCDVFIPLTALGYTNLTPRTIGILGVISSIAGLITILEPSTKLMPV